jgi:outer membrane immunogenic protein
VFKHHYEGGLPWRTFQKQFALGNMKRRTDRLLWTSLCIVLLSLSSAGAADMTATPLRSAVPSWSGFYLGANIGAGWGKKVFVDDFGSGEATSNPSGIVGGLQAGYNFQINSHLIGIEGNFDWSGASSSLSCFPSLGPQNCAADPRWIGAITGRLGEIVGPTLFYVKGGAAWVHDSFSSQSPGTLFLAENTRAGWTAGAGFEYMFLPNWSAKVEYAYYGFPDKLIVFEDDSGDSFAKTIKQNMQTVTVGINYHFNAGAPNAPVSSLAKNSDDNESVSSVLGFWGADVSNSGASSWAGTLIAPRGDLDKSGPRVWFSGEAGRYKFLDSGDTFRGNFQSGEVLVGYGFESEEYSINLLAGANAINHTVTPFDAEDPVRGTKAGFKVRADTYWTPTALTMTSGEYEYSTAFNTYLAMQKIGIDVTDGKKIYVGPQVMFLGDQEDSQWRVGGHISNIKFGDIQIDVSAGYARDRLVGAGAYGYLEMSKNF